MSVFEATAPDFDHAGGAGRSGAPRLASVPDEVAFLDPWVDAGIFDRAEVHLAAWGARTFAGASDDELLALALAARGPRLGHVCVLPADAASSVSLGDDSSAPVLAWPEGHEWLDLLATSDLVGHAAQLDNEPTSGAGPAPGEPDAGESADELVRPLVLDGERLYLHRYWVHERSIAAAVRSRSEAPAREVPGIEDALDRAFGPVSPTDAGEHSEGDLQRHAARIALRSRIAVIAGGPGTGKTRTIARLLVAAAETGAGVDDIALAAPTGKASSRMKDALALALHDLGGGSSVPAGVLDALGDLQPRTVHKLLGWLPGGNYRHHADNRLPHRLVVVDEASMLAAGLMARLLEAVDDDSTIVLVGDPAQLASVEAGAVFGDLVAAAAAEGSPLARCTTVLRTVHRFATDSGISRLADAIRDGDPDAVIAALRDAGDDVEWVQPQDPTAPAPSAGISELRGRISARGIEMVEHARSGEVEGALVAARSTKVLCATRRGPNGMRDWSDRIERTVDARLGLGRGARWYVGRPVLVTRNDPVTGVVNGDVGVVVDAPVPDGPATPVAIDRGEAPLLVPPSRLSDIESWWAMTIHKSQGSEFDDVVVALPSIDSPILTRELLYTGVTRARHRVTVVATEQSIRNAVARPVARASGLRERLG